MALAPKGQNGCGVLLGVAFSGTMLILLMVTQYLSRVLVLFLFIFGGSAGLFSHEVMMVHAMEQSDSDGGDSQMAGTNTVVMATAEGADCATDFLCFIRCHESRTAIISPVPSQVGCSPMLSDRSGVFDDQAVIGSGQRPEWMTRGSPPDDPNTLLSIMKRE